MSTPPSRRPSRLERHEVQRRRERIIAHALLRPDAQFLHRLRTISHEQAMNRIISQSLSELGITEMARRKRIILLERKRGFAMLQLHDTRVVQIQDQFRRQVREVLANLRKEFSTEKELHDFLERTGALFSGYAKMLKKK